MSDFRQVFRSLLRSPGFTIPAILTLGLGIGASTAIFSVVHPVLFAPLPYPDSDRIVMIWDRMPDGERFDIAFGSHREIAERSRSFDALAVTRSWQTTLTGVPDPEHRPERLAGQLVSADWFRVLGMRPALGRDFTEVDDLPGAPPTVLLADGLWRRSFGADPAIVGREVTLDGARYMVVGVMPPNIENVFAPTAELWSPLRYDPALPVDGREWGHHLRMIGKLAGGVTLDQARAELGAITGSPVAGFARPPWASMEHGLLVNRLRHEVTREVRPVLFVILGAVGLLLVIACANVTNLMLARGARRRGELAVRAALGARRAHVARGIVTESAMIAAAGGALGILIAALGVRGLTALGTPDLPRLDAIHLDGAVLLFSFVLTATVAIGVGLFSVWRGAGEELRAGMSSMSNRSTPDRGMARRALVVTSVSLSFVLLVGAGLLLRSTQHLLAVDPGFRSDNVLTLRVQATGPRFGDAEAVHRFFEDALDAVRGIPGVDGAAWTSQLPLSGDFDQYGLSFESDADDSEGSGVFRYTVSPGYLETMGISLRQGRLLNEADGPGAPRVALINESLARRVFPDRSPIGEVLHVGAVEPPGYIVVGVVGDVKQTSLAVSRSDAVYLPALQWRFADAARRLVVRSSGDAAALESMVRNAIHAVDPDQPIVQVATLDALVAASEAERRFALTIFSVFALVALTLAAVGVYGVLSGSVTERTREIGVRSALGAAPSRIVRLVLGQGMALTVLGVVIGLAVATAASRVLVTTLLYEVSGLDPVTYIGVVVMVLGVSGVACFVPARRAVRVDPTIVLKDG